ncbi:MAG: hypothetical protein JWN15_346 [Firmicutes bacterium]|nr:hypothetical protein [Bacillota bacterium]
MSEERDRLDAQLQQRLQWEKELNARVHKHMGMSAAVLGLVATIVALIRIPAMFGVSVGQTFGILGMWIPVVFVILAVGALASVGTTRLLQGVEWVVNLFRGNKKEIGK